MHGEKDTAVTTKHAYYIRAKADEGMAPVEVLIVRNASHNWPLKTGNDMELSRDAIIEPTVQFFVDLLPPESGAPE